MQISYLITASKGEKNSDNSHSFLGVRRDFTLPAYPANVNLVVAIELTGEEHEFSRLNYVNIWMEDEDCSTIFGPMKIEFQVGTEESVQDGFLTLMASRSVPFNGPGLFTWKASLNEEASTTSGLLRARLSGSTK